MRSGRRRACSTGPATRQLSSERFRRVLGHLPTGVTVITAQGPLGPVGMAVNSLTSLSLDPPLVLLCPARSSTTWPVIREATGFCVNVMAAHHEAVTRKFALKDADRSAGVAWISRLGLPAIDDAVAWIDCRLSAEHEGGDHTIVVAEVVGMSSVEESAPLVFFRGGYGTFAAMES